MSKIAFGVIRTDQAGADTRSVERRIRRRIETAGFLPIIEYHSKPMHPDDLAAEVARLRAVALVVSDLGTIGPSGFEAVRDFADVWLLEPWECRHGR